MPKLCRVHLAGLGVEVARFNPLALDFLNAQDQPTDSVLWLRNGGGKTTLISLLYAAVLPEKSEFLGRRNGKNTEFDDYLRKDQLGVVLLELDFAIPSTPRTVIGVAAVRRERDTRKVFFTFREHGALQWAALPVLGLGSPARSLESLLEQLRVENAADPGRIQLYETSTYGEWKTHLDGIQLDPGVLRYHLQMNSDEGGVVKLFSFKKTAEFIQLFLKMAIEPEALYTEEERKERRDLVSQQAIQFREKLERNPHLKATVGLCDEMLGHVRAMQAQLVKRQGFTERLRQHESEASELRGSIQAHLEVLRINATALAVEETQLGQAITSAERHRRNALRYAGGYESLGKAQRAEETKQTAAELKERVSAAERTEKILLAAGHAQKLRLTEVKLAELRSQLEAKLAEHRPELEALREIGTELRTALAAIVDAATRRVTSLEQEKSKLRKDLVETQDQLNTARRDSSEAETNLERISEALRRGDASRRQLRHDRLIEGEETGTLALARWDRTADTMRQQRDAHTEAIKRCDHRVEEIDAEVSRIGEERTRLASEQAVVQKNLERWEARRATVASLENIRSLVSDGDFDPWNPALPTALREDADREDLAIIRLEIAGADDARTLAGHRPGDIFPPPADVETVLHRARQTCRSAVVATDWLKTKPEAEAQRLLREHPEVFAGLIIQDQEEFERIRRNLTEAQIRMPVPVVSGQILGPTETSPGSPFAHCVMPQEHGYWNADYATLERSTIESRKAARTESMAAHRHNREVLRDAEAQLRALTQEFQPSTITRWESEAASLAQQLNATNDVIGQLTAERSRQRADRQAHTDAAEKLEQDSLPIQNARLRLRHYIDEHESARESLQSHEREARDRLAKCRSTETQLNDAVQRITGRREEVIESLPRETSFRDRSRQELALLAPNYFWPDQERPVSRSVEELWALFQPRAAAYEGKINRSELDGQIMVYDEQRKAEQAAFDESTGVLPADEIEIAVQFTDLGRQTSDHQRKLSQLRGELFAAERDARQAAEDKPKERLSYERDQLDPERAGKHPITSAEAFALVVDYRQQAEQFGEQIGDKKAKLSELKLKIQQTKSAVPAYEAMLAQLSDVADSEDRHPEFHGEASADQPLTEQVARQLRSMRRDVANVQDTIKRLFGDMQHTLNQPKLAGKEIAILPRLRLLELADYEKDIQLRIDSLVETRAICEDDLKHQDEERRLLLLRLDQRAALAARRLKELAHVSHMPPDFAEWAGRPFIRITVPAKNDEHERLRHLGDMLDRWIAEKGRNIPEGVELAFQCLLAVLAGKEVDVKILKPEYRLRPLYYDIVEMSQFSDGEKVTAAIILYCVLVRLRGQNRDSSNLLATDSGFLLLDNPFGRVTLVELLDLQLAVSKKLGVQLIYASGVNDFGALQCFPHRIRLRNSSINPTTGDRVVEVDTDTRLASDSRIEASILGLKRIANNGHG